MASNHNTSCDLQNSSLKKMIINYSETYWTYWSPYDRLISHQESQRELQNSDYNISVLCISFDLTFVSLLIIIASMPRHCYFFSLSIYIISRIYPKKSDQFVSVRDVYVVRLIIITRRVYFKSKFISDRNIFVQLLTMKNI